MKLKNRTNACIYIDEDVNSWEKVIHKSLEHSSTVNNDDFAVFLKALFVIKNVLNKFAIVKPCSS